jgi:23S rRNA pseudouridine1911/1915/1917 synthase
MAGNPEFPNPATFGFPCASPGEPRILAERDDFLVVAKPEGMHCLPPGESLAGWLGARYPELAGIGDPAGHPRRSRECGLVHRLDRATSGLLLVARNDAALARFLELQTRDLIRKEYRFLSIASPHGLAGSKPESHMPAADWMEAGAASLSASWPVSLSSRFRPYGAGRKRVGCILSGEEMTGKKECTKESYTTLFHSATMVSSWQGANVFDCRATITKGFRHQIRAHAAWVCLPLLGDTLYGGIPAPRLCLHAQKISFPDPEGRTLEFEDRGDDP